MGASAGSNVACPTIATTNDMPIVECSGHAALGLIGLQLNPHHVPPEAMPPGSGETRLQRLQQPPASVACKPCR